MNFNVIFEHRDFLIINKPPNISVQLEQGQNVEQGLLPQLCKQLQLEKLWLVHRLDKLTSGLLLLAKNTEAAAELSHLFACKQIQKFYLAISHKKPKKKQGLIVGDMKKVRSGQWMLQPGKQNPACSQFFSQGLGGGLRLFVIKPHTGKTHQIRVALKSLGSPILGDLLYNGQQADRMYLHAFALGFHFQQQEYFFQQLPEQGEVFMQQACLDAMALYHSPAQLAWPDIAPHRS